MDVVTDNALELRGNGPGRTGRSGGSVGTWYTTHMATEPDTPRFTAATPGGVGREASFAAHGMERTLRKVPEVTLYFWITKVLTTALGESTSDFLVHRFDPVVAVAFGALALAVALILQFWVRRYIPWIYWLAVAMVAVSGTMAADVLHIKFGVPYA